MAGVYQLFSGSSGNCTYIGAGDHGILIDAGVSAKRITLALQQRELDPAGIQAIFVTHEHTDHICGVRVLADKFGIPVFASEGTLLAMEAEDHLPRKSDAYILDLPRIAIGDFEISSFRTSHDAAESCGYRVTLPDGRGVAVCTDLGFVSQGVREGIAGCDVIVMESNHDPNMLRTGPYPGYLKERIAGRRGHLSNGDCAAELPRFVQTGTTRLILSHLSKENNIPTLVRRIAEGALKDAGITVGRDCLITVAAPCDTPPVLL